MEIRKCTARDVIALGKFYDEIVKYLCDTVNYPKWIYKQYPSEQSVALMTEKDSQYVCFADGEIVGAFVLNCDPQGAYEQACWSKSIEQGRYLVCHTLAVSPRRQKQGLGKQIVEFCIKYARDNLFQAVRLDVVPTNYPARRLYERCGFNYVGDVDLKRGYQEIPLFSMYEFNLQ